jgi:hypothetical protein
LLEEEWKTAISQELKLGNRPEKRCRDGAHFTKTIRPGFNQPALIHATLTQFSLPLVWKPPEFEEALWNFVRGCILCAKATGNATLKMILRPE